MVTAPQARPLSSAAAAASTGISNWVSTTADEHKAASLCATSAALNCSLAPGSRMMQFLPLALSTRMKPTPVGASAVCLT